MEEICDVCGKPLDETYAVSCTACGRKIHFPPSEGSESSCGSIVTQLYACGLSFICSLCSGQQPRKDIKV